MKMITHYDMHLSIFEANAKEPFTKVECESRKFPAIGPDCLYAIYDIDAKKYRVEFQNKEGIIKWYDTIEEAVGAIVAYMMRVQIQFGNIVQEFNVNP